MDHTADGDYLAAGKVADRLHVSPKTVSRWADEGLIPCLVTLGGHRRFRREDIEAIAARMQNTTAKSPTLG